MRRRRRRKSWNDDRRGAHGFALWIGIGQMSRGGSELVKQDVLGGLGRRVLYWGAKDRQQMVRR